MPLRPVRFASIAVFGLGAFVAVSIGVTLYVSGVTGLRTTQSLLAGQAEDLLDSLEAVIMAELAPVQAQAHWVTSAFGEGRIDLARRERLDAFMLGALGTTPQVASLAVVEPSGRARRWDRDERSARSEDWSARAPILEWVRQGRDLQGPGWRSPMWTRNEQIAALVYETPLRRGGSYLGMLGQLVPVSELSGRAAVFGATHGLTAFILHGEDRVLAHPRLAVGRAGAPLAEPLPRIVELGDPILARLRTPDVRNPIGLRTLKRAQAATARIDGEQTLFLTRDFSGISATPWTIGLYLNPERGGQRTEMQRLVLSIGAGLAVLAVAVLAAAIVGRRLSRSVEVLADAARALGDGRLDQVPELPGSRVTEFDEASKSFNRMVHALRERSTIRETLGRFLPEEVARQLLAAGGRLEPTEGKATVLVCDIENFTLLTESLGPGGIVEFLNAYFEVAGEIVQRHGGAVTQFQGDAILAVFNLPIANADHGAAALRAAIDLVRAADEREFAGVRVRNRVGLYTGRVMAGAVGSRGRTSYTVHGNAVNLASRIEGLNKDYGTRILLAGKTAERCPEFNLEKVADVEIRGYSEKVPLYTVRIAG
jgi:class 3 adenylate cyclase